MPDKEGLFTRVGKFVDNAWGKVIQRQTPQTPTKPYLGIEVAIDEGSIYKRMKLTPYYGDELLSRKKIDIFNQMMQDSEIESSINTLKTIRLSSGWEIIPATETDETGKEINKERNKEIADFVEWNLKNVEGSFEDDLREIMGAVEMGISLNELIWNPIKKGKYAGKIGLTAIKSKNPKYFNIAVDDFDNLLENGIVNISSIHYGERYPTEKFIIYSFNKRYENVFGVSRIRSLYDLWFMKQVVLRAFGVYIEKFGHPWPIIKHPKGIDARLKSDLLTILRQLRLEAGMVIPNDVEVAIQEVSTRGSTMFLDIIDYIDKEIRKTILGQTLTAETGGTGSYALGKVHFDILLFYEEQLADDLEKKAINQQLIKRLVDYNYLDVQEYPEFKFKPLIQEDITQIIDKYYQGVSQGAIKPIPEDEEWIRDKLKLPKRKTGEAPAPIVENPQIEIPELTSFKEDIFTGVRRRTLTKYEEQTDFKEIKDTQDDITERYRVKIGSIIKDSVDDLIEQIGSKKIIEEKNINAIPKLKLKYVGDVKREFQNMMEEIFRRGKSDARKELAAKRKELKFVSLQRITPTELLNIFDKEAFWMAGVERDYIEKEIKEVLFNAIKTGANIRDTIAEIQSRMEAYYIQGEPIEEEAMTGHRLETVIRTKLSDVYNQARRQIFEDEDLEGFVEAYQYSAILDDRVRKTHAEMDGRIYSVNNPIWDSLYPPNGYNCFDELTEVYTNEGWKFFKELRGNESFLSLSPQTKDLEWQKAIRWYKDKYEGEMYHFHSWNFDLKCTPNHSLLVKKSWDRHQKRDNLKFIFANQIADSDLFYRTSKWIGRDKEEYLGFMSAKTFARFMGYWLSEGSITKSNKWVIKISQNQQDKKYEIIEKLSEIKELLWIGKEAIYIKPLPILSEYLSQFGKSFEKYIPIEIKEMTKENIREFLDAYLLGDGHIIPGHKFENGYESYDIKSYTTSSKKMAEDLGELILKVGHYPSFSFENNKGKEVEFRNGIYKLNTNIYFVRELESEYFTFHKKYLKKERYEGYIYCVEIPKYHTLWIRRNNKTTWAGNCRCLVIPIVRGEQWEESPPPPSWVKPDEGFDKPGNKRE